jgi:predicted acetyltransferase
VDIRELGPADDPVALLDLSVRAFGPIAPPDRTRWQENAESAIGARQYLGVFDGGQLLAAARYHDMVQWWHGQPVPMAGVASVAVAPEERGRGTGRALMRALLELIGERGFQISALYPATLALYRSLGWEIAGGLNQVRIPARSLRSLVAPDATLPRPAPETEAAPPAAPHTRMHRCGPHDATDVLATVGRVHQALRDCGPNTRDEAAIARWLSDEQRFAYLATDGFLAYRWQHGNDELLVERVIASSAAVIRAIWGIVASHSSIASTVQATVGPADPLQWLTTDPDVSQAGRTAWMLRVVDAAAAVAGRGFPPGIELTAILRLVDPDRPAHDGWWTLDVGGSKGVLTPAEPGPDRPAPAGPGLAGTGPPPAALTLGPRGFAALYAGTPLATLRRAGLAAGGDPGGDAALDAAFGADPFMLEYF